MASGEETLAGAKTILPIALGVAIYGLAFGLLASQAGLTPYDVGIMGGLVFAGSSQIVAVERLTTGAGIAAALIAAIAINLRYVLITASIRDLFENRPLWQKVLGAHMTSDENWALTLAKRMEDTRIGFWFLVGGGITLMAAWTISGVLGVLFATAIPEPENYGIDFAFTAAFIAITCSLWRGREDILPWFISASVVIALVGWNLVDTSWAIVIGGVAGAFTGACMPSLDRQSTQGQV